MANNRETRAQALQAVVRGTEEVLGSRMDRMEEAMMEQSRKLDTNIAEIFEAIRLMREAGASTSNNTAPPGLVPTPEINIGNNTPVQGTNIQNQGYQGVTRLSKLDFPKFDGSGTT